MKINTDEKQVEELLKEVKGDIEGQAFTEATVIQMQDKVELALLEYSKKDIENLQFLNPHVKEEGLHKTLQLFIDSEIYVEVPFTTIIDSENFPKIEKVEAINILKADSL